METATGQDPVLLLQIVGGLGIVSVEKIHSNHAYSPGNVLCSYQSDRTDGLQTCQEQFREIGFLLPSFTVDNPAKVSTKIFIR